MEEKHILSKPTLESDSHTELEEGHKVLSKLDLSKEPHTINIEQLKKHFGSK